MASRHEKPIKVQPVFDLDTGSILYAEVFGGMESVNWSSWRSATEADLEALRRFIEAAEELYGAQIKLGFNLSICGALTFGDAFTKALVGAFHERVLIELTEHLPAEAHEWHFDQIRALITRICSLGAEIALDDVSAQHPYRNPRLWLAGVSVAKVLVSDPCLVSLAESCRRFGVKAVAENIETMHDLEIARSAGIKYGQGYLLACPMSAQELGVLTNDDSLAQKLRWRAA